MTRAALAALALATLAASPAAAQVAQVPWGDSSPEMAGDRIYSAEQFSNTVSVSDPITGTLLGVIRLGDPQPANFSPLYRGQVLVHGLGFSPDGKTIAAVSIGSNAVSFIDTATNQVKHTTYIGRSPHEAFYTRDGKEVWVTVRGEDYISIIDAKTFKEVRQLKTPGGPGMTSFSPDGRFAYVCSSFNPELVIFDTATKAEVGRVAQPSPFCPNIAATPDGKQVWYTLKDVGKVVVIDAKPPFATLKVIDTGAITNHVNFASTRKGLLAYVTIGGSGQVSVFRTDTFARVGTVDVGAMPHGLWPSGDGRHMAVGLENDDELAIIDTASNKVVRRIQVGQAPQAIVYVPGAAARTASGQGNLQPLGLAGRTTKLRLAGQGAARSSVTLFDQGLIQVLQASVTGLQPKQPYQLVLSERADGLGNVQPLANFNSNPAGAAIVNASGPLRQIVEADTAARRMFLAIREAPAGGGGKTVLVQAR